MLLKSSFSHLLFVGVSVATCAVLAPQVALAQTSASETARVTDLFKRGKAAFGKGDMPEAERLFAEALSLRKSSDIAANLAQAELEQQKFRQSSEHFSWALANLLPSATDAQRKAVENGLARARAEVGMLRLDIKPDGADVLVGQENLGKSPVTNSVFVDPGEVIISVKHEGFVSLDKRVMVGKGTEQAVELSLTAKEGPPPAPPPVVDSGLHSAPASETPRDVSAPPARKSLVPAFIATGVAVAGGAVGLGFTLRASSKEKDADELRDKLNDLGGCGDGGAPESDCGDLKDQRESVDSSRHIAIGAFVVGGVAALAAGYFYWDALSSHGSARAERSVPRKQPLLRGLLPTLAIDRAHAQSGAVQSVRLGLSGTF